MSEHKTGQSTFDKAAYWQQRKEGLRGQGVAGIAMSGAMTHSQQPHLRDLRRDKWKKDRREARRTSRASARGE